MIKYALNTINGPRLKNNIWHKVFPLTVRAFDSFICVPYFGYKSAIHSSEVAATYYNMGAAIEETKDKANIFAAGHVFSKVCDAFKARKAL